MDNRRIAGPKAGFTLIELSVVLVIIALLVGAIAGLRTYTRNAGITAVFNEAKIYISAFNQFQTRYNAPPGDYPAGNTAWTGGGNGDGNGLIRADTASAPNGNRVELFYTFRHLALAGFIMGSYTGTTTGGGGTYYGALGTNLPRSSMDNVGFLFDHPDFTDATPDGFISGGADPLYFNGQYPNVLRIAGLVSADNNIPTRGWLTPKQALQVDEKYDDGRPATGMYFNPRLAGLAGCANNNNEATAVYDTSTDGFNCWMLIKIQ